MSSAGPRELTLPARYAGILLHDLWRLGMRATVMAGEAALWIADRETALDCFERALRMNPPPALEARARQGVERCSEETINRGEISNEQTDPELELTMK